MDRRVSLVPASTRPFKFIPKELIDAFIDALGRDRKALKACRLVCRDWLLRAGYNLFDIFLLKMAPHHDPTVRYTACRFRELIQSPHTTIGASVRRLIIHDDDCERQRDDHKQRNCMLEVISYLDHHARITYLRTSLYFRDSIHSLFVRNLRHLKGLHLNYARVESFQHLSELVCSFPKLAELTLTQLKFDDDMERSESYKHLLPLELYYLCLDDDLPDKVLRWLLSHKTTSHLSNFDLTITDSTATHSLLNFLHLMGPHLKHIHLHIRKGLYETIDAICRDVELSPCINLSSIAFDVALEYDDTDENQPFRTIPSILSRIRSNFLTSVRISFTMDAREERPPLSEIRDVLTQPQFRGLQTLQLILCAEWTFIGKEVTERALLWTEEVFSAWKTGGILEIYADRATL